MTFASTNQKTDLKEQNVKLVRNQRTGRRESQIRKHFSPECTCRRLSVRNRLRFYPFNRGELAYQIMDDDFSYFDVDEPGAIEMSNRKRSRSKSLPNNALLESKRNSGVRGKLHILTQAQHEHGLQRRRSNALSLPLIQIGKEIFSNSAKDIEFEKKRMEYVLEKEKRLQADTPSWLIRNRRRKSVNLFFGFVTDPSAAGEPTSPPSEGAFAKWKRKIHRKVSSGKNLRTAEEGHKRATQAMNAAEEWLFQMEDSLQQEEQRLCERALDLRRQSLTAFKLMSDVKREAVDDNEENLSGSRVQGHDDQFYHCLADETTVQWNQSENSTKDKIVTRSKCCRTKSSDQAINSSLKNRKCCHLARSYDELLHLTEKFNVYGTSHDGSEKRERLQSVSPSTQEETIFTSDSNPRSDDIESKTSHEMFF